VRVHRHNHGCKLGGGHTCGARVWTVDSLPYSNPLHALLSLIATAAIASTLFRRPLNTEAFPCGLGLLMKSRSASKVTRRKNDSHKSWRDLVLPWFCNHRWTMVKNIKFYRTPKIIAILCLLYLATMVKKYGSVTVV